MTTRLELYNLANTLPPYCRLKSQLTAPLPVDTQVAIIQILGNCPLATPAAKRLLQQLRDNKIMWDSEGNIIIKP